MGRSGNKATRLFSPMEMRLGMENGGGLGTRVANGLGMRLVVVWEQGFLGMRLVVVGLLMA